MAVAAKKAFDAAKFTRMTSLATAVKEIDVKVRKPSQAELKRLYDRAGMTPREGLRAKEALASELGLNDPSVTDDQIIDAMTEHPILIERPLVETEKGVKLCRPQDGVRDIL